MLAKISAPAARLRVVRLSGPHVGCLVALVKRRHVLAARHLSIKPKLQAILRLQPAKLAANRSASPAGTTRFGGFCQRQ